jgi:SpoVK/Ycf46/Vps4 family AAA+-type ATPase
MLNVETRFEIPRIVEALKARGHGTLCFYGAPGTGKTALGEHIAQALERPLIVKQASDLMSKYVGETEQNMAAMFREAEAEKAVLLLDEADSFCRTAGAPSAPTKSPRSTRCCKAWSASTASSSAPPTCWTASTRRRCAASPSRSSSSR